MAFEFNVVVHVPHSNYFVKLNLNQCTYALGQYHNHTHHLTSACPVPSEISLQILCR